MTCTDPAKRDWNDKNNENMQIKTYMPTEKIPENVILPEQVHGTRIVEVVTGDEDLNACDGIWTRDFSRVLGVRTADCAPIVFWEKDRFGILHVGWRGLCDGIIEKMLGNFTNPQVFVGPFLPKFQIQKDFCYEKIVAKFGEKFLINLEEDEIIIFDFQSAIRSVLTNAKFDGRSTFNDLDLASWRRDRDERRNVTVIENKI